MPRIDYSNPAAFEPLDRYWLKVDGQRVYTRGAKWSYLQTRDDGESYVSRMAGLMTGILGIQPTDSLVILGSGYGYTAEYMRDTLGFTRIIGIDTSTWIHSTKDQDEEADFDRWFDEQGLSDPDQREAVKAALAVRGQPRTTATILNEDGSNNGSRRRIRAALTGDPNGIVDWVVSEALLPVLDDAEAQQGSGFVHQVATNVGHIFQDRIPFKELRDLSVPENEGHGMDSRLNWHTLDEWHALLPNDWLIVSGGPNAEQFRSPV